MINTQIDTSVDIPTRHTCVHTPCCPTADDVARDAAHVVSARPEQGWSLLCNGVVVFEDFGELLPERPVHRLAPRGPARGVPAPPRQLTLFHLPSRRGGTLSRLVEPARDGAAPAPDAAPTTRAAR